MEDNDLRTAVADLWRARPSHWDKLYGMPEFQNFSQVCISRFNLPNNRMGTRLAISDVLRAAGAPFAISENTGAWNEDLTAATRVVNEAFSQTKAQIRYLCPLDLADNIPQLSFGNARVQSFRSEELKHLFNADRLRRHGVEDSVDWRKLSEFTWLVVEDEQDLPPDPGQRSVPMLYQTFDQDFGSIDPHKHAFPAALHDVMFFIAAAPWQEWAGWNEFDWRGFNIPWFYTASSDLLDRPHRPPSHDTLSWEPYVFDDDGEQIEIERPIVYPLDTASVTNVLNDAAWRRFQKARSSPIFGPPVDHFLVRGYMSEGIEEFLAHITTIEAGLGSAADHVMSGRKGQRHRGLKATARVAARLAGLLGDPSAADNFRTLFKLRSEFLHGAVMGMISGKHRRLARTLAQRAVAEMVKVAASPSAPADRDSFLSAMLDAGSPNT